MFIFGSESVWLVFAITYSFYACGDIIYRFSWIFRWGCFFFSASISVGRIRPWQSVVCISAFGVLSLASCELSLRFFSVSLLKLSNLFSKWNFYSFEANCFLGYVCFFVLFGVMNSVFFVDSDYSWLPDYCFVSFSIVVDCWFL